MSHTAGDPNFKDNGTGRCWHCGKTQAEHGSSRHRCSMACCPSVLPPAEFTAFLLHDTTPNGWTRHQDGVISRQSDCGITFIWQNGTVQSRLLR